MEREIRLRTFLKNRFRGFDDSVGIDDDLSGVVDSLGIFELIEFVEAEFEVRIPTAQFSVERFSSISRICQFVDELRSDDDRAAMIPA